jgi:uncharacterized membrane protein HdeD (DUF308 family)
MDSEKIHVIEIGTGAVSIIIGFILHWWSTQILWILIHPPPLAKQLIEGLPFVFWVIGALLIVDGVRRMLAN